VRAIWRRGTILVFLVLSAGAVVHAADAPAKKKGASKAAPAKKEAPPAAVPGEHPPEVGESFKVFCGVWMGKLVERERFNKTQIKWRPAAAGVEGEYIGYSSEHNCELRPPTPSGVPIGRLTYREMIYRKRGDSADAASASEPEVVEVTEITEIFRREKGKWIY